MTRGTIEAHPRGGCWTPGLGERDAIRAFVNTPSCESLAKCARGRISHRFMGHRAQFSEDPENPRARSNPVCCQIAQRAAVEDCIR